jgi:hypothetical protein
MSAEPPVKGKKLADFVRRNTAVPTLSFFRALNFELYTKCAAAHADARLRRTPPQLCSPPCVTPAVRLTRGDIGCVRGNAAVAVPGTVIFLGTLAYFAMLKSDEAGREQERQAAAAAAGRREALE